MRDLRGRAQVCEPERADLGHVERDAGTHRNVIEPAGTDLFWIHTEPEFAIGQWALLVRTPAGNIIWDSLSYLDEDTVATVNSLGGLAPIAISHPHFYGSYVEWSEAFGGVPIYLHALDREHAMRPSEHTVHVEEDELELLPGISLIRLGGHFHGSTVLAWSEGADGQGALLTGDTLVQCRNNLG